MLVVVGHDSRGRSWIVVVGNVGRRWSCWSWLVMLVVVGHDSRGQSW